MRRAHLHHSGSRVSEAVAESRLWEFSLRTYGRPGVADACLWLQDERGLDVNLVLFLAWTGLVHGALPDERLDRALALSRSWSDNVVARLRAVRRWMKTAGTDELPGTDPATCEALRREVVELERHTEKLQQAALETLAAGLPTGGREPAAARASARRNLERYLTALGLESDQAVEVRLATILDAARR